MGCGTEKMFEICGLKCIHCGRQFPNKTLFEGCLLCRDRGIHSNVTVIYNDIPSLQADTDLSFMNYFGQSYNR